MLEIGGKYFKPELSALLGSRDTRGLEQKMQRYGIIFSSTGRANERLYTIHNITNPFKVFAITELGFDGNTNFTKLRNFYYHYFEDEVFRALPDEVKEVRMRAMGQDITRQTIANYTRKLETNNLISRYTDNYLYYFAFKQTQRFVDRKEYLQAWSAYWHDIQSGLSCSNAILNMREEYGGVARKQPIPMINGIYNHKIELMLSYIQQSIESECSLSQGINTNYHI